MTRRMLLYKIPKRLILLLGILLSVEYLVVHQVANDALKRSDAGLARWKQLAPNCNCTDCKSVIQSFCSRALQGQHVCPWRLPSLTPTPTPPELRLSSANVRFPT